jgi:hypothetical protein
VHQDARSETTHNRSTSNYPSNLHYGAQGGGWRDYNSGWIDYGHAVTNVPTNTSGGGWRDMTPDAVPTDLVTSDAPDRSRTLYCRVCQLNLQQNATMIPVPKSSVMGGHATPNEPQIWLCEPCADHVTTTVASSGTFNDPGFFSTIWRATMDTRNSAAQSDPGSAATPGHNALRAPAWNNRARAISAELRAAPRLPATPAGRNLTDIPAYATAHDHPGSICGNRYTRFGRGCPRVGQSIPPALGSAGLAPTH